MRGIIWGMKVNVKLIATYRELLPPECKGKAELDVAEGMTAVDLLAQLGVPIDESVVLVDGRTPDPREPLKEGDSVCAFSATAGG